MMENRVIDELELVEPASVHRDQVMEFLREHQGKGVLYGSGGLDHAKSILNIKNVQEKLFKYGHKYSSLLQSARNFRKKGSMRE